MLKTFTKGLTKEEEHQIVLEDYDKIGEDYAKADQTPWNMHYERPNTLSLLPNVAGLRVLDSGCGAGWYTEWLVRHGAKVTAMDFSPKLVNFTKNRVQNANVKHADLEKPLDFLENESVDLVIAPLILHYLKDWSLPMSEFNRILSLGGNLVFSIHHPFTEWKALNKKNYFECSFLEDYWKNLKKTVHYYGRPLTDIFGAVTNAGFVIEKILEPMPEKKFEELDSENYELLMSEPWFLFIRARKDKNFKN